MTRDRPHPDPFALAAQLRLWAIAFVAWLADMLGGGPLSRAARRWVHAELKRAEQGAAGLVVLAALKLLPAPVKLPGLTAHARPGGAPRGFARVRVRGNDMRRITRHLFMRERDVFMRARRLGAVLDTLADHARRLARRIARVLPATRLAMGAVPADALAVARVVDPAAFDTS